MKKLRVWSCAAIAMAAALGVGAAAWALDTGVTQQVVETQKKVTDTVGTVTETAGNAAGAVSGAAETAGNAADQVTGGATGTSATDQVGSQNPSVPSPGATLPPEVVVTLPPEVIVTLPPEVIGALPPEIVAILPPEVIKNLPPEALVGIAEDALATLPPEVAAVVDEVTRGAKDVAGGAGAGTTPGDERVPGGAHTEVSVGKPVVRPERAVRGRAAGDVEEGRDYAGRMTDAVKLAATRALELAKPFAPPLALMAVAGLFMLAMSRPPTQLVKADKGHWTPTGRSYRL